MAFYFVSTFAAAQTSIKQPAIRLSRTKNLHFAKAPFPGFSATVIHNYDIKREDGTTATTRLFDIQFPDLFSWLLDEMGGLPLPRKRRERVIPNPLKLLGVSS